MNFEKSMFFKRKEYRVVISTSCIGITEYEITIG